MFSKIEELIKNARYEELNLLIVVNKKCDDYRWVWDAKAFNSAFDCLDAILKVLEPVGGKPCIESVKAAKTDLYSSSMIVTFLIPKKRLSQAMCDVICLFQSKHIEWTQGYFSSSWFTLTF